MGHTRDQDEKALLRHPPEVLMDLFFSHIRNIWRVDGLYFQGIEEKLGTEFATEIDSGVHKVLGNIEAKVLPSLLGLKERGIPELVTVIKHSSWYLDLLEKTFELEPGGERAVLTVDVCGTQLTRMGKGLPVFPCKQVRRCRGLTKCMDCLRSPTIPKFERREDMHRCNHCRAAFRTGVSRMNGF